LDASVTPATVTHDGAIPTNQASFHVNQGDDVEDVTQARGQVNIGPIARGQAKKVWQQVTKYSN
jgi:hypothetical protein